MLKMLSRFVPLCKLIQFRSVQMLLLKFTLRKGLRNGFFFPEFTSTCWLYETVGRFFCGIFNDICAPPKTRGISFSVLRNLELTLCRRKIKILFTTKSEFQRRLIEALRIDIHRHKPLRASDHSNECSSVALSCSVDNLFFSY